jgi:hypothetical protein
MSISSSITSSFQTDTTIHTAAADEQVTVSGLTGDNFVVGHYRGGVLLSSAGIGQGRSVTFQMQDDDELHAVCVSGEASYVAVAVAV